MSNVNSVRSIEIKPGGANVAVDVSTDTGLIHLTTASAITLAAANTISATGTVTKGTFCKFITDGLVTSDTATGKHISIFGHVLKDEYALYEAQVTAYYDGSVWSVRVCPSQEGVNKNTDGNTIVGGSIPTSAYAPDSVDLEAMAPISQGSIIYGGASNEPSTLDISTEGNIITGDGTDAVSVPLSGAITIDSTGLTTIADGYITTSMLAETPIEYKTAKVTLTSSQILSLSTANITLIAGGGENTVHVLVDASVFLNYGTTYAGGGTLGISYVDSDSNDAIFSSPSGSITGSLDTFTQMTKSGSSLAVFNNKGFEIYNDTAAFTGGTGTATISLVYYTLTIS